MDDVDQGVGAGECEETQPTLRRLSGTVRRRASSSHGGDQGSDRPLLKIEKFHKAGRKPPPWLKTDKPWDDPDVTGKPAAVDVRIPPLDSLTHEGAYFRAVNKARLHGGLLDGLRQYYTR
jgi:hypothetical protein